MNKKFDWNKLVEKVIDSLGGKDNIKSYKHCATRLRVELHDNSKVDKKKINNLDLAKGYNLEGTQHQIIYGAGTVNKVYSALSKFLGEKVSDVKTTSQPWWDKSSSKWSNIFSILRRALRNFADIFIPLIPVLIAGGIGLAMNSLLTQVGSNSPRVLELAKIFDLIGGTIYTLLPAFIGYTLMKKLGGNVMIGMAIGLILVGPALMGSWTYMSNGYFKTAADQQAAITAAGTDTAAIVAAAQKPVLLTIFDGFAGGFFKIEFASYQSQIVPVMLAVILAYWIERGLKRFTPEAIAIIAIPVLTVFLTTYLSMWAIGPAGRFLNTAIAKGFNGMYQYTNYTGVGFGGMIIGALWTPFVITGLHQAPLMMEPGILTDFNGQLGHSFTWLNPVIMGAQPAMGCSILAVLFHIRKEYRKQFSSTVIPASLTANMGITEPAIFGVGLPLKYPMIGAMVGGAVAGYWSGMTQYQANSIGSASWIGIIQYDFTSKFTYGDVVYNGTDTVFNNLHAVKGITRGWMENGKFHVSYFSHQGIHSAFQSWPPAAHAAITLTLGAVFGFLTTFLLGRTKWAKKSLQEFYIQKGWVDKVEETKLSKLKIMAPTNGKTISLKDVNDGVFSEGTMGEGVAITLGNGIVKSPVSGEIVVAFETGHAYGIKTPEGHEILVHIGINTVNLKGKGFEPKVKQGQKVKVGQTLAIVDTKLIKSKVDISDVIVVSTSPESKVDVKAKDSLLVLS